MLYSNNIIKYIILYNIIVLINNLNLNIFLNYVINIEHLFR